MSVAHIIPRVRCKLVKEGKNTYRESGVSGPKDSARLAARIIGDLDREIFMAIALDAKNTPIATYQISVGTLNTALVHPREVFKPAILLSAHAVIVAHNHPSGDPTPSDEDRLITHRLYRAGELLGIKVLDSLVIGADGAFQQIK